MINNGWYTFTKSLSEFTDKFGNSLTFYDILEGKDLNGKLIVVIWPKPDTDKRTKSDFVCYRYKSLSPLIKSIRFSYHHINKLKKIGNLKDYNNETTIISSN